MNRKANPWPRQIEVYIAANGTNVDVITRQSDEFTNAVARRIQEILARFWGGRCEG